MVHGGLEDYRTWTPQLAPLSAVHYRAITYSQRYNFPNRNGSRTGADYSAQVDAGDLAMLIDKLHLGPVHLVGHSYGGLAALFFTTEHPELVRTLTLSEPPVLPWVKEQPGGAALVRDFFQRCWDPLGQAFARHKRDEVFYRQLRAPAGRARRPRTKLARVGNPDGFAESFRDAAGTSAQRSARAGPSSYGRPHTAFAEAVHHRLKYAIPK